MTEPSAEKDAGPKRCPHCGRVAFRTMTDYLCISGCGWHEHHNEPIPTRDLPPVVGTCPDCGQPVTRDQPVWGPRGGPFHHDPCPIPPAEPAFVDGDKVLDDLTAFLSETRDIPPGVRDE